VENEEGKIRRVLGEELSEEHVETRTQGLVSIKLEEEPSSLGNKEVWLSHVEFGELGGAGVSAPKLTASWRRVLLEVLGLVIIKEGVWVGCGERTRGAFSFHEA
jgi:hypothetical protein